MNALLGKLHAEREARKRKARGEEDVDEVSSSTKSGKKRTRTIDLVDVDDDANTTQQKRRRDDQEAASQALVRQLLQNDYDVDTKQSSSSHNTRVDLGLDFNRSAQSACASAPAFAGLAQSA